MRDALEQLGLAWTSLGLADVLDILVIAAVAYGLALWLKRSRARFPVGGLVLFASIYVASRALDMYLTRLALQTLVTVALVAAVVIFQDDLRRAAERFGAFDGFRRSSVLKDHSWVDTVVETMAVLSRERMGALIVVKGSDRLEHALSGGVPLGGKPSTQLLLSLFDPRTPGHDGAVILHRGRIARFGVHLPLSTKVDDMGWLGTRHAAALGLAERSDALVLLVSEESGRMRVAEDGRLTEVDSVEPLKARIERFIARVAPASRERRPRVISAFTGNLPMKGLSLGLAGALWLFVVGLDRETSTRTFTVPIVLKGLPEGWDVTRQNPLVARVIVSGPNPAFRVLDKSNIMLQVPLKDLVEGEQALSLEAAHLTLPDDLAVRGLTPRRVLVQAHRMIRRRMDVRPELVGELPRHLVVTGVSVEPSSVEVLVPEAHEGAPPQVSTTPVDLREVRRPVTLERALVMPSDARLSPGASATARVRIEVQPSPG
jgi:diadenylate cyclase